MSSATPGVDLARGGQVEMLDVMSDLLSGVGEGSPPDAFFSRLCEAICRLTSMKRAVLFDYDADRRRVRAAGAHGIELAIFAELFVTIDSVPVVREALAQDRIQEVRGASTFNVPAPIRALLEDVPMLCTPMTAAGRFVGVVFSERLPDAPRMDDDERNLLWTLGKAVAMASVAREVTASDEQRRQLQQRIDLTREIHEGVVQRLFGVSLALSGETPLDADTQRRSASEVQAALADLSAALQRPLGHSARPTAVSFAEELERMRALNPEIDVVLDGEGAQVPRQLEALAQSVLVRRCATPASTHADRCARRAAHDDGATCRAPNAVSQRWAARTSLRTATGARARGQAGGVGLRLATLEALQHDGVLEDGESEPGVLAGAPGRADRPISGGRGGSPAPPPAQRPGQSRCACSWSTTTMSCIGDSG